ncbi:MAG: AAA family ATPase [Bacteroides sp.]|nr:AAA family ATPase [Prevotella sp.]MCM1408124.1 AAA family ATPase [Treponema brennaborense]MCM1469448.1 AAA family ATPase [Bacteroides sp.]
MQNKFSSNYAALLSKSKNLILHGAPGTGKTYLAKQIALEMIFPDCGFCVEDLDGNGEMSEAQIKQFNSHYKMVQFHPSYDYTDFVEGLRPAGSDENGNMRFARKDGAFKEFCKRAKIYLDILKAKREFDDDKLDLKVIFNEIENEKILQIVKCYLKKHIEKALQVGTYTMIYKSELNEGNVFDVDYGTRQITYSINFQALLQSDENIEIAIRKDIFKYFFIDNNPIEIENSSLLSISDYLFNTPFIFHIDEINRGEVSRIFGELFFCAEPKYRGRKGLIQTQYQNLVEESDAFNKGFFIPENVYIIGTMNDIDRSVETLDFAFRRRFLFREITAEESAQNMGIAGIAEEKMSALNDAIANPEIGLNASFHIGASYFKDCNTGSEDFSELWDCKLEPLLREYLRGEDDAEEKMKKLRAAFGQNNSAAEEE